jgi:hypothetical protein
MYFAMFLINFISTDVILDLSCSLISCVLHLYNKVGIAKVLYIFSLVYFWTREGFKVVIYVFLFVLQQ